MVLGIGGLFFTLYAPVATLFLMFIDMSVDLLKDKWQEFRLETEDKPAKTTPQRMMME